MTPRNTTDASPDADLTAQRAYAERMKQEQFDFGLTVADAFVRGIRDIGYRHTGTALDESIDNSFQAGAENVHVAFAFGRGSDKKPSALAVVDDGHGMDPDMIRLAVVWGGTHRENDRGGFGRYGYGLPSSCVSQGRRFSVFSRTDEGEFHRVSLDLREIAAGEYTIDGKIVVPDAVADEPPAWVEEYLSKRRGEIGTVRTVVLIEELDRLSWKTTKAMERNLLQHFGVTYRNFLRDKSIYVNGTRVQAIDPLFLTPAARFYDLDEDKAEPLDPMSFDVKDESRKVVGTVRIRFSYMPPTFQREDKSRERGKRNGRHQVMKDHNGIIVMRNGRQIDVVTKCPWTTFINYDRNWGIEVDFPASLDEEFSITTSKQQVVLSERMWELLRENGVARAIALLRKRFKEDRAKLKATAEVEPDVKQTSEQVMEELEKVFRPALTTPDKEKKAEANLQQEAKRRAKESGVPEPTIADHLIAEARERPYKVEHGSVPGGPFFHVEQRGGQAVLILNTAHRFYTDVYAGPDATPRLRAAIEILLWVIGQSELDASVEGQRFYLAERAQWSTRLEVALDVLDAIDSVTDAMSAEDVIAETDDDAAYEADEIDVDGVDA